MLANLLCRLLGQRIGPSYDTPKARTAFRNFVQASAKADLTPDRGNNSHPHGDRHGPKLAMAAQRNRRRLRGFGSITQVLEFAPFRDGVRQEEESAQAA